MIHVVTQEIATTAQFHDGQRVGIFRINPRTAMVCAHHSATQFASKVRIVLIALVHLLFLLAQLFCSNGSRRAERLEVKRLVVVASRLLQRTLPEAVSIVAIQRNHLAKRHRCSQCRPSCACIERQVETYLLCYALQSYEITAPATILVVKLCSDYRTAVFPLQALRLCEYLSVELIHVVHEYLVLLAHLTPLCEHPVGNAAIAHLTVAERAKAQYHRHILLLAHLYKAAQVSLSAPVEDALLLFYVVPENVGGDDGHAAFLYLAHLVCPFVSGNA